ncbi:MAG: hypothetical protein HFJ58_07615 [Clostridia bacterium]|nr:hypothetical protein [Clostridia bacterium]
MDSFNSIADQYTDSQLKVIIKFLPLNVRAVLETKSPKYQSLISFGGVQITKPVKEVKKEEALKIDFIENQTNKPKMTRPVIVPSAVDTKKVTKLSRPQQQRPNDDIVHKSVEDKTRLDKASTDLQDMLDAQLDEIKPKEENRVETITKLEESPKRGRGRPKKIVDKVEEENKVATPKRGRGRPRKNVEPSIEQEEKQNSVNLFDLAEEPEETILPGIEETIDNLLPGFEKEESNATILPGLEEENTNFDTKEDFYKTETISEVNNTSSYNYNNLQENNYSNEQSYSNEITKQKSTYDVDIQGLLSRDKKIVSFVGTTKNGTSFLVNNLGELFSSMGINTAILDVTKNRNSYYIYTKNEEKLRRIALNSMNNLSVGQASGIQVNRNLTVYTSIPTEENNENCGEILATLVKNYSLVLIDCDFDTNIAYFENSQEIYLVQSMDILTIQPLTAFLRDLKAKNVLSQDKIRIVINKEARIRSLTPKVIIGGMAYYNDPSMSFMTELFNKDSVRYCTIPFDEQVYSKYLEGLVNCNVSLNGYPKNFMIALKELGNMVYPLLNNKYRPVDNYDRKGGFSSQMNSTLEQMKRKF